MEEDFPQLDVPTWIARLKGVTSGFRAILGAAELAAAQDNTVVTPSAYVYPLSEVPGPNTLQNVQNQVVTARMAVAIAVRNLADPVGYAAQKELKLLRQETFKALLGWAPDSESDTVKAGPGRLMKFSDQVLWWQDEYTTQFYRRVV